VGTFVSLFLLCLCDFVSLATEPDIPSVCYPACLPRTGLRDVHGWDPTTVLIVVPLILSSGLFVFLLMANFPRLTALLPGGRVS
jgi:hypothetical protein